MINHAHGLNVFSLVPPDLFILFGQQLLSIAQLDIVRFFPNLALLKLYPITFLFYDSLFHWHSSHLYIHVSAQPLHYPKISIISFLVFFRQFHLLFGFVVLTSR